MFSFVISLYPVQDTIINYLNHKQLYLLISANKDLYNLFINRFKLVLQEAKTDMLCNLTRRDLNISRLTYSKCMENIEYKKIFERVYRNHNQNGMIIIFDILIHRSLEYRPLITYKDEDDDIAMKASRMLLSIFYSDKKNIKYFTHKEMAHIYEFMRRKHLKRHSSRNDDYVDLNRYLFKSEVQKLFGEDMANTILSNHN